MESNFLRPTSALADPEEKLKCIQDAKEMYQSIVRYAEKSNSKIPPYDFLELIGKGAFGRVYKCRNQNTGELVAIKMTNVDAQDYESHWAEKENNIRDLKKEISMMQQLKDSNARNVLAIHEAFDLGPHVWIVSDYCTGGSVRTLLRAIMLLGKGLDERYIIPIARELAIAIKGMHEHGVMHRDIKCSNVYVNEDGGIRLGDFGIVAVVDDNSSKRKTVIGTLQYMPKELVKGFFMHESEFEVAYGKEVDVWSYGCTLVEMATGHPPNSTRHSPPALAASLELAPPRLQGDGFSTALKDLVAFCLHDDPKSRPSIDAVLEHPYIANTEDDYPTSNLIELIDKFKIWMHGGGSRTSLWLPSGADARSTDDSSESSFDEAEGGWNFSTSDKFDQSFGLRYSMMFPPDGDHGANPLTGISLPPLQTHDLPVAEVIKREQTEMSATRGERSLDRLFNPETPAYQYTPVDESPPSQSDLPLRNFTANAPSRESVVEIDLDAALTDGSGFSDFSFNENTIKAGPRGSIAEDSEHGDFDYTSAANRSTLDWKFPASSTQQAQNRKTMEWTFNTAGSAFMHDSTNDYEFDSSYGSVGRPGLNRTATEPIGYNDISYSHPTSLRRMERDNLGSIIDLDLGLADVEDVPRPRTAGSATGSATTEMTSGNPFDLEDDQTQDGAEQNRFSYHRQWQSEDNRSSTGRELIVAPMHARGHSLSSTDSELDRPHSMASSRSGDPTSAAYAHSLSGFTLDNGFGPSEQTAANHWPDFDSSLHYTDASENTSPTAPLAPRQTSIDHQDLTLRALEAPHPDVMIDNAHPQSVEAEWTRQLDDLQGSLHSMVQVLRQYALLDEEEDEAELTSEPDSGFDSV